MGARDWGVFRISLFFGLVLFWLLSYRMSNTLEIKSKAVNGFLLVVRWNIRSKDILCEHLCWKYLKCECHLPCISTAGPHQVNKHSFLFQSFCPDRRFSELVYGSLF